MADIHKAGLLVIRDDRMLLCRKKHSTSLLILPGGKLEPGELPEECLRREVSEELGDVDLAAIEFIGTYADQAAGAEGQTVQIELYAGELTGEPSPQSEIGELVWFAGWDDRVQVSPSIRNKIIPDLIARGILGWAST
jgi:ADP-ribose pyrophosphatase YjhB (NUDIX family)